MENASKALIMAGSVLLSVLIISALILMFNQLSSLKNTEINSNDLTKVSEYNKQIENFERAGLYGSEMLSLINLIEDYNEKMYKANGYEKIECQVEFKNINNENFPESPCSSEEFAKKFSKMENNLDKLKNKKYYTFTVEQWYGMKFDKKKEILSKNGINVEEATLQNIDNFLPKGLQQDINDYTVLEADIKDFKNSKFQKPVIEYGKNGNIKKVSIKQINT